MYTIQLYSLHASRPPSLTDDPKQYCTTQGRLNIAPRGGVKLITSHVSRGGGEKSLFYSPHRHGCLAAQRGHSPCARPIPEPLGAHAQRPQPADAKAGPATGTRRATAATATLMSMDAIICMLSLPCRFAVPQKSQEHQARKSDDRDVVTGTDRRHRRGETCPASPAPPSKTRAPT